MKKKVLLLVLTVISVVAIWTVSASAASESDLTYNILMGSATITGCNKDISGEIVIPSYYEGYPVSTINSEAFSGCRGLTSITIPDTVTWIKVDAFKDCTGLTSVHITDIKAWCGIIFESASNPLQYAKNLYLNEELVTDLVLPDDLEEISGYSFYGCTSLKSVTIPGNVTSIGYEAFGSCENLEKVTIVNGVTSIGERAFSSSGLTSIVIPDSVTDMGNMVFFLCTNLTDATIGNGVTTIGSSTFAYCYNLESITIPGSVTAVGDWAFSFCSNLESVYITDINAWCNIDFEYVDRNPLYYGAKLYLNGELVTNLIIPDDVKEIKCCAFSGCSSLKSVTIPDSVTSIGYEAFKNCTNLNNITIPNSVTSIGNVAFADCGSLKEVYYNGTESAWKEITIREGNEPLTGAAISYIAYTKTDISDDGKDFSITPKNIKNGKVVILALYDTDKFVEAKILTYTGDTIPFSTDKTYTKARVMVWSNITDIEPVCTVENVK